MQFHEAQFGGIDGGKTKTVRYLPYIYLFHQDRIIADVFDDTLDPLFAAELKINHAARDPGLYGLVPLFQYEQIALRISIGDTPKNKSSG